MRNIHWHVLFICQSVCEMATEGMPQMPNRMETHNAKHNVLIIIIDNKLNCQHFSAKYRFRWIIVALSARHTDRNYMWIWFPASRSVPYTATPRSHRIGARAHLHRSLLRHLRSHRIYRLFFFSWAMIE